MRTQRTGCNFVRESHAALPPGPARPRGIVLSCRNFHIMHCEHTTAVNERPGTPTPPAGRPAPALAPAPAIPAPAGPCTSWPLQWLRGFPSNDFPSVDSLYYESVSSLPAHYSPRKSGCTVSDCVTVLDSNSGLHCVMVQRDQTGREHSAVCTLGIAHPILQPTDCTPYSAALFCTPVLGEPQVQFPKYTHPAPAGTCACRPACRSTATSSKHLFRWGRRSPWPMRKGYH